MINSQPTGVKSPPKTTVVQAAARATGNSDLAAANDETNPLWLIAAGMAIFLLWQPCSWRRISRIPLPARALFHSKQMRRIL